MLGEIMTFNTQCLKIKSNTQMGKKIEKDGHQHHNTQEIFGIIGLKQPKYYPHQESLHG
jgi:hypothetical protein